MIYKKQHGVSLIEVLIALVIFSFGMMALMKFQAQLMRSRTDVGQHMEALHIAKNKLDSLQNYVTITPSTGVHAYDDIVSSTSATTIVGTTTTFSLTWVVTDVTSPPQKNVTISVGWTDSQGGSQSVSMNSIIGKVDPAL